MAYFLIKEYIDEFPYTYTDKNGTKHTIKLQKQVATYNPKLTVGINLDVIDKDLMLAGYNLFVISELKMKADNIYSTCHNLWRIEESFKEMKSYLDTCPVYLQKIELIHGHFLIYYLEILLIRFLQ